MQYLYKKLEKELDKFNTGLNRTLKPSIFDFSEILDYIADTKGKQIRPIIGILTSLMLGRFEEKENTFLQIVELIHNATLFHDDVIDEAKIRRKKLTLNEKYSNKTAVLTGDYFLSCAIKNAALLNNPKLNLILSDCIKKICEGEIEQNLTLYQILPIEKYLEKTMHKTALLFSLATNGIGILFKKEEIENDLREFGLNFGMLFQLKDDINNFKCFRDKPVFNDLENGVITAPVIFLSQENKDIEKLLEDKQYEKIISLLESSAAFEKTNLLVETYRKKAINNAKRFPDNEYKTLLVKLLTEF